MAMSYRLKPWGQEQLAHVRAAQRVLEAATEFYLPIERPAGAQALVLQVILTVAALDVATAEVNGLHVIPAQPEAAA